MPKGVTDIDLHGKTVLESETDFHAWLNRARVEQKLIEIQFITGPGKIQNRLRQLSVEHDLNHYIPLNNRGCLVVEFE